MSRPLSKSALIDAITGLQPNHVSKRDVRSVIELLAAIGHGELKKNGVFVLAGLAKFVVVKRAATKEREGINPFTGQPTLFKAKPARRILKVRPLKVAKNAIA